MTRNNSGTVVITGASGVLGQAIATELATTFDVICLRHREPINRPGIREVTGDLTQPNLGLTGPDRALLNSADIIVHCAATTAFHNNRTRMASVNIAGTERVLDLAAATGAKLMHVSTAFVARHRRELVDQPLTVRGPTAYVESKAGGENLVRTAGLGALTVRPSVVIGDSRTGEIRRAQGLHSMCGQVMRSEVPLLSIDPAAFIDCVPQDYVARAIGALAEQGVPAGEVWLTAGTNALTAQEVIDTALAVGTEAGLRPHRFRVVDPEMVERLLLPMVADPELALLRRRFEEMSALMELFAAADPFPSTWEFAAPDLRPRHDDLLDALEISLRWWAEQGACSPLPWSPDGDHPVPQRPGWRPVTPWSPQYKRHLSKGRAMFGEVTGGLDEVMSAGAWVFSSDGRRLLDCGGYGVFLHGHRHPVVLAAVIRQLERHPMATRVLLDPVQAGRGADPRRGMPRPAAARALRELGGRGHRGGPEVGQGERQAQGRHDPRCLSRQDVRCVVGDVEPDLPGAVRAVAARYRARPVRRCGGARSGRGRGR